MNDNQSIFICPVCFQACDTKIECHQHMMIECNTGKPGDERRKPVEDLYGHFVSRAPLCYLEALGWIKTD
jgi:hypothetical protein